jgi:hypothetical protein
MDCHMVMKHHSVRFDITGCLDCHSEENEKWAWDCIKQRHEMLERKFLTKIHKINTRYDLFGIEIDLGLPRYVLKFMACFVPLMIILAVFSIAYLLYKRWRK